MISLDRVAELAMAFPEVTEGSSYGHRAWTVPGQSRSRSPGHFAWVRPFSKADLKRFGDDPVPPGDILAVRVADLDDKDAALTAHPECFFTIPHFEGFAAVLIALAQADRPSVRDALEDGWLACASPALVAAYLDRPRTW